MNLQVRAVVCSQTYQLSVVLTGKRDGGEFASVMAVEVQPDKHRQPIAMLTATSERRVNLHVMAVVCSQGVRQLSDMVTGRRGESEFACDGR